MATKTQYVLLTLENGQRLYLQVTGQDRQFLRGIEVTREGEMVAGTSFHQRRHIIEKAAITKSVPYQMNVHYATLERVA